MSASTPPPARSTSQKCGAWGPSCFSDCLMRVGRPRAPGVEQRLHPHVLRREAHLLGIHEEHAGILAGGDHACRPRPCSGTWASPARRACCSGAVQHQRAVSVVGRADHHHVDIVALQQRAVICAVVGEAVRFCESLGVPRRRRCHRDQLRVGVAHERAGMNPAHELRTRNPTPTGFVIDCLAISGGY